MRQRYRGFLLLETMIAMAVIVTGILLMVSTSTFILSENKRCEDELEMAILLYEMSCATDGSDNVKQAIYSKGSKMNVDIQVWRKDHLRIESDSLLLEIEKNK